MALENLTTIGSSTLATHAIETTSTAWFANQNRLIEIIERRAGMSCGSLGIYVAAGLILGVALGAIVAWKTSIDVEKLQDLKNVPTWNFYNSGGELLMLGVWLAKDCKEKTMTILSATIFLSSVAAGMALGVREYERRKNNGDHRMQLFIQNLQESSAHDKESGGLYLRDYSFYLRCLNLIKLGRQVRKEFKPLSTLIFKESDFSNSDLQNLSKAGWFRGLKKVDASNNPQLTACGLNWIGKGATEKLEELDLSSNQLTDSDLQQMAEFNAFKRLKKLVISNNPQITGKGLAWITKKRFEGLQEIDVSQNAKLTEQCCNAWIRTNEFQCLTIKVVKN